MRGFVLECEKGMLTDIITLAENNEVCIEKIEQNTSENDDISITLYIDRNCNIFNIDNFIKDVSKIRRVNSINMI